MVKNLKKEMLSQQIYDDVVRRIRNRELRSGDPIVVRTLQQEYGVSSTPARDAINMLNRYGFLDMSENQRTTIVYMTRKKVMDWIDLMEEHNSLSAEFCFKYDVDAAARAICAAAQTVLDCDPNDPAAIRECYRVMCNAFADHCGNTALSRSVDPLLGGWAVAFGNYDGVYAPEDCLRDARQIIDGFQSRDLELVRSALLRQPQYFRTATEKEFPPET